MTDDEKTELPESPQLERETSTNYASALGDTIKSAGSSLVSNATALSETACSVVEPWLDALILGGAFATVLGMGSFSNIKIVLVCMLVFKVLVSICLAYKAW